MVLKNLRCFHCETDNCEDIRESDSGTVFFCKNCGFAFNPDPEKLKKLNDPNPGNFLPCIPLKGVVAREPLGKTPDGYTDPVMGGAQPHTLEEYKEMFFIDPEIYLEWSRVRKSPHKVPGFGCKESAHPSPQPAPQPSPSGDDPAKLKQDQMAGRISRKIYLEKLMALLKGGKVAQAYYDLEKKRILAEI